MSWFDNLDRAHKVAGAKAQARQAITGKQRTAAGGVTHIAAVARSQPANSE